MPQFNYVPFLVERKGLFSHSVNYFFIFLADFVCSAKGAETGPNAIVVDGEQVTVPPIVVVPEATGAVMLWEARGFPPPPFKPLLLERPPPNERPLPLERPDIISPLLRIAYDKHTPLLSESKVIFCNLLRSGLRGRLLFRIMRHQNPSVSILRSCADCAFRVSSSAEDRTSYASSHA